MPTRLKSDEAIRAIKEIFLQEYEHFADKRTKNIDKGDTFIVDDRHRGDFGADRRLFLWFCMIFARIVDQDTIEVTLNGGVPQGDRVEEWCTKHKAKIVETGYSLSLSFEVKRGHHNKLSELADAIGSIVRSGVRYPVASYKYVCPRTAGSLSRLRDVLIRAWGP